MLKKLFVFASVFVLLYPAYSFATSGACSGHGGVSCSSGADQDGSVICTDGWRNSSVSYSSMVMCSTHDSAPSYTYTPPTPPVSIPVPEPQPVVEQTPIPVQTPASAPVVPVTPIAKPKQTIPAQKAVQKEQQDHEEQSAAGNTEVKTLTDQERPKEPTKAPQKKWSFLRLIVSIFF